MRLNPYIKRISKDFKARGLKIKGKSFSQYIAQILTKAFRVYTSLISQSYLNNNQKILSENYNPLFGICQIYPAVAQQINASFYDVHVNKKKNEKYHKEASYGYKC